VANITYNKAKRLLLDSTIDLVADTIKAMAVTSTYTPNADDTFIDTGGASDPVDARVSGTTDQTLGTKSANTDLTNDFAFFKAANVTFSAVPAGATVVGIVLYKDTGTPTTSPLIAYYDITDTATNGGDIVIQWAADASGGVLKLS
jgi:hypothetical protein